MKISVIIPTYNVEKYIRTTIDSLINQKFDDFEIIIVDDESTDNTFEIINEYSKKYKNVIVDRIKHSRGPGKCRNIAIHKAKGKYIYFVDGDDFIPDYALANLYNLAEQNEADIVVGRLFFKDKNNFYSHKSFDYIFEYEYTPNANIRNLPPLRFCTGPSAKLYKKTYLDEIKFKFPEETFFEDFPVIVLAYYLTDKIYLLNELVYGVRIRDKSLDPSITQRQSEEQVMIDHKNMKKYQSELLEKHNITPSEKQIEFENYIKQIKQEIKANNQTVEEFLYSNIDISKLSKSILNFK